MKSRYLSLVFLATTLAGVAAAGAMAPSEEEADASRTVERSYR